MLPKPLAQELHARGVILEDITAFWQVARDLGTLPRWRKSIYTALRARYAEDGTPIRTYAEISECWGLTLQAAQPIVKRALDRLAHPERVVHYGHYLDTQDIHYQLALKEESSA